jgi:hypothetical protein
MPALPAIQSTESLVQCWLQKATAGTLGSAVPADVVSIVYSVIDMLTGLPVPGHDGATLVPSAVVLSTPVTAASDPRWRKRTVCNYQHALPASALPSFDRPYRYEAKVTFYTGQVAHVLARLEPGKVWAEINFSGGGGGGGGGGSATFEFATNAARSKAFHGTTRTLSPTFGVSHTAWNLAFHFGLFVTWRDNGALETLLKPPQSMDELRTGITTGPGTYTMRGMWEYVVDRAQGFYPNLKFGVYLAGGIIYSRRWLYETSEFTSVYPQGHVDFEQKYGFNLSATEQALGYGLSAPLAITSSASNGAGKVRYTVASTTNLPLWSRVQISGHSVAGYNDASYVIAKTATTFDTDQTYSANGTGGTVAGGIKKLIQYGTDAFWADWLADALAIVDTNRSRHPRINNVYLDEQSHEQSDPLKQSLVGVDFMGLSVRLGELKEALHARSLGLICNITWQMVSKGYIVASANNGAGKLAFTTSTRLTVRVGDTITVSGHSVAGYNATHTVTAVNAGRQITTDTAFTSAGTGGNLTNNNMQAQLDASLTAADGYTFEGHWFQWFRTQAHTEQYVANLRYLLDRSFTLVDVSQARPVEFTIASSANSGGNVQYTLSTPLGILPGMRIGVFGHSVSGYNAIQYVKSVAADGLSFVTDATYTASGTGGGGLYSDTGRIVAVDSVTPTGVSGAWRVNCATPHRVFPVLTGGTTGGLERREGKLFGPASYDVFKSGGSRTTYSLVNRGFASSLDLTVTGSAVTDRGYLVDVGGHARFSMGFMALHFPGLRAHVWLDPGYGEGVWETWVARLGAPSGNPAYTYSGGDDPRCTLISRSFANGSIQLYPDEGYVVTTIGGVAE